jgi:hypothetical protein
MLDQTPRSQRTLDIVAIARPRIRIESTAESQPVFHRGDLRIAFDIDGARYANLVAHLKRVAEERSPLTVSLPRR